MSSYLGIESHVLSLIFRRPFVTGNPDISLCRATVGRLFLMTFGGTSLGCCAGGRLLCLVRLLLMRCLFFFLFYFFKLLFILVVTSNPFLLLCFVAKEHSELESKFDEQVQAAVEYARTIEDFDKLIDPHTLARHCLGPEPSLYVLSILDQEEKKRKLPLYRGLSLPFFFFVLISFLFWCRDDV